MIREKVSRGKNLSDNIRFLVVVCQSLKSLKIFNIIPFTELHVLRVVYRMEGDTPVVITFYPGRRERYESGI